MIRNTKNKWIAVLCVIFGLCLIFGSVYTFRISAEKSEDLWPENGEVIAKIQGKEYRYDPIYLYRLTSAYFADDPNLPNTGKNMYHMRSFESINYGHTLGELAIALELLYMEALETVPKDSLQGVTPEFSEERQWEWETLVEYQRERLAYEQKGNSKEQWQEERTYLDDYSTEQLNRLAERHKDSKFWPFQSNNAFFENLNAYDTKMHCIDLGNHNIKTMTMGIAGIETEEERNEYIFDYLVKKYNVTFIP